ncbi:MAG: ACT domain-containing protein [Oscillospiraceae bacterium]
MSVKQISVFLENRPGALEAFTQLLGQNDIDLIALSIADTTDFGILRAIVSDNERTLALVRQHGYTASLTDVLAVAVPDAPGGLAGALATLREGDVSIEYLYSFVRRVGQNAIIIFRVDKPRQAESLLGAKGIRLLSEDEIAAEACGC